MKAITIQQPYATLIAIGAKQYETRSWKTKFRGEIAIHAAKNRDGIWGVALYQFRYMGSGLAMKDCFEKEVIQSIDGYTGQPYENFYWPIGSVVATAELVDCIPVEKLEVSAREKALGWWKPGYYAWKLLNVQILKPPIPATGKQGVWEWTKLPPYWATDDEVF